jgi:hypothetical protein
MDLGDMEKLSALRQVHALEHMLDVYERHPHPTSCPMILIGAILRVICICKNPQNNPEEIGRALDVVQEMTIRWTSLPRTAGELVKLCRESQCKCYSARNFHPPHDTGQYTFDRSGHKWPIASIVEVVMYILGISIAQDHGESRHGCKASTVA